MSAILKELELKHVGYIVSDIEATWKKYAAFFGMDEDDFFTFDSEYESGAWFRGNEIKGMGCQTSLIDMDNTMVELIQPNDKPSAWREHLEKHGDGMHHLAFQVEKDALPGIVAAMEAEGYTVAQTYDDPEGTNGYVYMDATNGLACFVELFYM